MDSRNSIEARVKEIFLVVLKIAGPIENNDRLTEIGADSIDLVEIVQLIESEFKVDVEADVADQWNTVGDVIRSVRRQLPTTFTQEDVDSIVTRAKQLGAGPGLVHKQYHLQLSIYGEPHGPEALAMLIIYGWHEKYDLIHATQALIEFLLEKKEA